MLDRLSIIIVYPVYKIVCYDYSTILQNSLLFYEAQRSGKLPSDQKVTWRKDSALNDKGDNGEDLTGGYYDEDGRKAVKWATDYFIKAHTSEFEFYGQVGDVWGAAWLYRATEDNQYLDVIEQEYPTVQYWIGFDWDQKTSGADVTCYDYTTVLQDSLLFYEAQRSGKLPSDQRVTWRKDSALNDKGNDGEDLTGGYYDAGDYVKFGFPMAFTTTVLSWGLLDHENGYQKANSVDDCRKAIKWATDWFLKAHVSANEYYGQVGSGTVDHASWGRPEDMTMERPAFKITTSAPGSDLAAETAAALAAASLVFQSVDSTYAATLLEHAKQLYDFGYNYRGLFSDSITDSQCCYTSTHYEDELVWGAAWLYRATNDQKYLGYVDELYSTVQSMYGFDWDQKFAGAMVSHKAALSRRGALGKYRLCVPQLSPSPHLQK
uniref:cellulase n=1 Tax=Timema californicum TaxID=61474 RepID=A0A7R9J831_TIMCA|nr:unnamed protein product [Timema californicum]